MEMHTLRCFLGRKTMYISIGIVINSLMIISKFILFKNINTAASSDVVSP